MTVRTTSTVVAVIAFVAAACGGRTVVTSPRQPMTAAQLAELRVDPGPVPRDLFWGVGGPQHAPPSDATYRLVAKDATGFSVSFDVTAPDGIEWSAKVGPEAQTEVVMSRILWGLGYHQPPVYYLPTWTVRSGDAGPRQESEARFRPKLPGLARMKDAWAWADNPFSGTPELKGLLVVMLMFNSTDLKDSNNAVYQVSEPPAGIDAARGVRWFVVRDLGASLGETGKLFPRRNWLEGFEERAFIVRVSATAVEFDYDGRHKALLTMIGPADVQWAARQMMRLTDAQWRDAFRAANYPAPQADRYIKRIREKMDDGLAVRVDRRVLATRDGRR
jgi:hypothetical protein